MTEKYNLSICDAKGIIWAASEYQSEKIAQQIVSILHQSHWAVLQCLRYTHPNVGAQGLRPI